MDLRHFRYFVAVAEEGHITRAAERLGIQQPPLSQQIKALERELDVQLLRRRPRGVELTEAGRAFLADARAILAHVDHALATTRRTARGEQGRICVGFTSSAPFHPVVPRIVRAFREALPMVSLTLEESGTTELIEAILAEEVDAAFIRMPATAGEGVTVRLLLEEPMLVAFPERHPLAHMARDERDPALRLRDLKDETFIIYRRRSGPGLYDAIFAACHAAGFSPRVGQEAPRIVSTLNLVAAGLGISIVPESLQRMHLDGVSYRPLKGAGRPRASLFVAARRGDASPIVRRFLALATASAASYRPAQP